MMQESRYYGVAWNYIEDTYRATGLLADVKNYEDAKEKMFVHNSIEKTPDGTYKIPKVYYHQRVTEPEVLMEISDGPLQGFELYPEPLVVWLLHSIEYDVFKSCIQERKKMKEELFKTQKYLEKRGIYVTEDEISETAIRIATRWGGNYVFVCELKKLGDKKEK